MTIYSCFQATRVDSNRATWWRSRGCSSVGGRGSVTGTRGTSTVAAIHGSWRTTRLQTIRAARCWLRVFSLVDRRSSGTGSKRTSFGRILGRRVCSRRGCPFRVFSRRGFSRGGLTFDRSCSSFYGGLCRWGRSFALVGGPGVCSAQVDAFLSCILCGGIWRETRFWCEGFCPRWGFGRLMPRCGRGRGQGLWVGGGGWITPSPFYL